MKAKLIYSIEKKDGKNMLLVYDSESKRLLHEFELDKFDLAKLYQQSAIVIHANDMIPGFNIGLMFGNILPLTSFEETMQLLVDDDTAVEELRERARKELEFLKDREQ